jgi:hypothetical protein
LRNTAYLPDTSIVTAAEPCVAPCWDTITPGETFWDDALLAIVSNDDYQNLSQDRTTGTVNFSFQDGPQCCRLFTRDGETLASITLLTTPQVKLSEVIERYDEPDYIRGDIATNTQAFVSLYYADIPMIVFIFAENLSTATVDPDSDVIGYIYMTTDEMEQALQMTNDFYDWTGYTTLADVITGDPVAATLP